MESLQFDKIKTESVVNHVVDQITALIINKAYKSGDKIPTETELAEQLGVSRNSIREAIKILSAVGILEIQRGKGTYIAKKIAPTFFDPLIFSLIIEPKSSVDLYEFRVMFESMIIFCAIDKLTPDQIDILKAMVVETKRHYFEEGEETEVDYYLKEDIRFHQTLLDMTANPLIQRIGSTIMNFIPAYIEKSINQENGILRSIENHEAIIDTLESKDKDSIVDIIEATLSEWKNNWAD